MPQTFHQIVWIDHQCARLYDFTRQSLVETRVIHATDRPGHLHHHAGTPGPGHAAPDNHFLATVAEAVAGAQAILIVGPGEAKGQLSKFVHDRLPDLARRIVGVEPQDRVGNGELHAFAKRFFARADRMAPSK